jgi:hypothetical protein
MRLSLLLLAAALAVPAAASALTEPELAKVIREIDERQRNQGDWKALCYMEQKERDKTDVIYELLVYRRDADDKQMFLFTKPRSEAGKGYLRIEKNLWLYDPSTGRWERRTERERIGGTNTRRGDLDESRSRAWSRSTTRSSRPTRSWACTRSTGSCSPRSPASTWRSRSCGCGWIRRRSTS